MIKCLFILSWKRFIYKLSDRTPAEHNIRILVIETRYHHHLAKEREREAFGGTGNAALKSIPPLRHLPGVLFGLSTSQMNLFGIGSYKIYSFRLSTFEINLFGPGTSKNL